MASTCRLQSDKLDELSTSDSRSKQKEKTIVSENKAMIGARHGYDYVDLITMAIILKAGSMMKEDELFSCEISKEDATAGKFDDIVFRYTYKGSSTILKIQVKHRTKNQEISLQELMETSFTEPFALIKYFKSFLDQYTQQNDNQMFILCTNVQVNNDAAGLLEKVRPNDVCNIFDPIGAIYYRFRKITQEQSRNKKCIANALKKASESYRLAEILANHIHGKKELVLYTKNLQRNPPLSKYNNAIVRHMIDYSEERKAFHINHNFISNTDLTVINFRKQFENAYTEIADFTAENFDVYGDITTKGIKTNDPKKLIEHIRNIDQHDTPEHFPTDIITDDDVNLFFDKFLIVCDTFSTDDLPSKMAEMWRDSKMCKPTDLVCSHESEKYIEGLHRTVSNWMKSSPNLPTILEAKHVEEIIKKVKLRLKYLLLKKASNKYIADHHTQSLRAKPESLREKPLYKFLAPSDTKTNMTKPDIFTLFTPYNSQFSSMIVLQTFQLLDGNLDQIVFIDANTIKQEKQTLLDMCVLFEDPLVMVIECEGYLPSELDQWKQTLHQSIAANNNPLLKIVLVEKYKHNFFGEEFCFSLKEFEKTSIEKLITENGWNTLFGTFVPIELFIRENDDVSMILNFIEDHQHAEPKVCLVDNYYERIRLSYIHRCALFYSIQSHNVDTLWSFQKLPKSGMNLTISWDLLYILSCKNYGTYKHYETHQDGMERIKTALEKRINHEFQPDEPDWQEKVHILLGEAGCGKSSYLSWLGWYLQNKDRSSWVIRFNAIDFCTDFERLGNEKEQLNNTEAMRLLYRMIHLALFVRTISTTDAVRKEAGQCADLLEFDADRKAIVVNEEKWKTSEMTSLQLIMVRLFQNKFNNKSLIVLFDGFDEIIPDYKDVVFNLLARIQEFDGIKGMYVTSRPYNLHDEFEKIFSDAKMHSFASFTQTDRLAALHMFMRRSFPEYISHELEQQIYLLGSFLHTIEILLKDLGEIPIYLTMAMEVLTPLISKCVNFKETTINTRIMKDLEKSFEKLHLIEQFVHKNLFISNFAKHGIESVVSNPGMKSKMDKQTLRMHSVLALYVIFNTNEREKLHVNDIEALEYMEDIKRGDVKTGIIEAVFDSKPLFIHRSFAEYFAAVWLFENMKRPEVKLFFKSLSYWSVSRKELRQYFDQMLISKSNCDLPIHMAIANRTSEYTAEELKDNESFLTGKDLGGRTVFHLLANYYNSNTNEGDELNVNMLQCWPDLNEKDEFLNWSALDYALIQQNHPVTIYLLKFGAWYDLRHLTQILLTCDEKNSLKSLIEYENFITYKSNLPIHRHIFNANIMERFEKDVVKRVVDFVFSEKTLHLAYPSFADLLVRHDAVITLKTVCQRDPELFSPCRIKKLLITAFDHCAVYVVEYLIAECGYDLPLEVEEKKYVLFTMIQLCIAHGCNKLFTILYKSYCVRRGIEYNEPISSANKNQDNLRFAQWPYLWNQLDCTKKEPEILASVPRLLDKFVLPFLVNAVVYFNICVIDNLLPMIKPIECYELILSIAQQGENEEGEPLGNVTSRLKYLIEKSTNLMYTNRDGATLLHHFIQNGFYNLALFLIEEYWFDIGHADIKDGWNAFHYCANINPTPEGFEEKNEIALEEYKKLLNFMLAKKHADLYLSTKDKQGRNVLRLAIENYNTCAVKIILQRNLENWDEQNLPAALVANIVGKTIHQLNNDTNDMTLLNYVIELKHYNLAKFLIQEYGFDIWQTNSTNGRNAFHCCANIPYNEYFNKQVWELYYSIRNNNHADLHLYAEDHKGRNVLYYALINGNVLILNTIISKDLLVEQIDDYVRETTHLLEGDAEGMTLLHFSIASKLCDLAIFLIEKYQFDIGKTDTKNGWNALHYCADNRFTDKNSIPKNYTQMISHIISKDHADHLSVKDKRGRNVLHIALINENICMTRAILQKKLEKCYQKNKLAARVDDHIRETTHLLDGDAEGTTLLHFAIQSELFNLAIFLVNEYRYDIDKTDTKNGWNAFHYCAHIRFAEKTSIPKEYTDLLCLMMSKEHAEHLSVKDKQGRNVLHIALMNENICMTRAILQMKLEENNQNDQLAELIDEYIRESTDLLEGDAGGITLLHFAIESELYDLGVLLIEKYGFNVRKTNIRNGWNAFHYCANIRHFKNVNSSINNGYNNLLNHMMMKEVAALCLSAEDAEGRTVIETALTNGNFLIASHILEKKLKESNELGRSAATHASYIRETFYLLEANLEGMTLLHFAIGVGQLNLAIYLIEEHGFDIGKTDAKNGWNAFHYCATFPVVEVNHAIPFPEYGNLLDHMFTNKHVDIYLSTKDKQGRNVLHIALINRSFVMACYILHWKMKERNEKDRSTALNVDYIGETTHLLDGDGEGMTLLHYTISSKKFELAIFLIEEYGVNIGKINPINEWNAFHCYATIPFPESGEISIQYKKLLDCMIAREHADLYLSAEDQQGRNPLQLAAINYNFYAMKYIFQKKFKKCCEQNLAVAFVADILGKTTRQLNDDTKGMTLLHYVISQKYYRLAKFLIEAYGFDIGQTDTNNGWNAFHYCAQTPSNRYLNYAESIMLLNYMRTKDRYDIVDAYEYCTNTPLSDSNMGLSMLFNYMLTKDHAIQHLSAIDLKGRNVLHYAVINGNIAIAYAVLETMLKECNKQDHPATLIDNYIRETTDLLEGDAEGMTLLHFAIVSKQYELAVFRKNRKN